MKSDRMKSDRLLKVGHSPDPDDAFMFYGLASEKVKIEGIRIEHVMEDIQSLNERAFKTELEVTAISAHAFTHVCDNYWIMRTGASMGEGYGPIIVSKKYSNIPQLSGKTLATPGKWTTASLLYKIYLEGIKNRDMPFDRIIDAVLSGEVDAGLLIHEGQINYNEFGLNKLLDFGEVWQEESGGLPLPLGLDVVRKDLGQELASRISKGLQASIHYGYKHQNESIPYAMQFGRGINKELGEKFVKMYVSEITIDMGEKGAKGLQLLFQKAYHKKLIPRLPEIELY